MSDRLVTFIKVNDVLYSRDLHCITVVNNIITDKETPVETKDTLFDMLSEVLNESEIKFSLDDINNTFILHEKDWQEVIKKKKGPFVTKKIYEFIIQKKLDWFIYNSKLIFYNEAQLINIDSDVNMIIINGDLIDDIKILRKNDIDINLKSVVNYNLYSTYILTMASQAVSHDVKLYLNIITGDIDDMFEIDYMFKDDPSGLDLIKNILMNMFFIQTTTGNMLKAPDYKYKYPYQFAILNLFDVDLQNKIYR